MPVVGTLKLSTVTLFTYARLLPRKSELGGSDLVDRTAICLL
jgi:hypothetical protein